MVNKRRFASLMGLGASLLLIVIAVAEASDRRSIEWPQYGGNQGFSRYSPANLINPSNVKGLKILWVRPALEKSFSDRYPDAEAGTYFRPTPIMIEGVLYSPNGVGLVEAFEALTGKTIWVQEPPASDGFKSVVGFSTRGVAFWKNGTAQRVLSARGDYLYSLDAATGKPDPSFGEQGRVSLSRRSDLPFFVSAGPLVANDLVIVGGGGGGEGDYGTKPEGVAESVRAYEVRTGRLVWEFSPLPAKGDRARDSWGDGAADIAGYMGSYGTLSFDPDLGYVYIAFGAPNPPAYGGWRPGDNLYSNSLVAVDVRSGRKIWHQQLVRHDVWDFDLASPPVLGDITVAGKRIKAVMQTGKMPLLFTFDRRTGEPVWPIDDVPVSASKLPGERLSPTQPIPTKPAPLDRVGVTEDDLIDFTPQLRQEALTIFRKYESGPIYTPPSLHDESKTLGTLTLPGTDGGGNWNTGAFDPETGTYYGATTTVVANYQVEKTKQAGETAYKLRDAEDTFSTPGPQGLPLVKPPYGRITAVDMSTGSFRWVAPVGEGPRNHPALQHLKLPRLGIPARVGVAVTKSLIFAGQGSDAVWLSDLQKGYAPKFNAYDKRSGELLAEVDLPAGSGTTAAPMTYTIGGKQLVVVAIGGMNAEPAWVAFGL